MTPVAPRNVSDISCKTFQYTVELCSTGVVVCSTEKYFCSTGVVHFVVPQ